MTKRKLIISIIVITIIVIALGLVLIKNKNNSISENRQIEETTNKIATKKENSIFKIYNTDIKNNTGSTKITATVKNKTEATTEEQEITVILLDKNKNEIGTMKIVVPSLKAGSSTQVMSESLTVYENIDDFIIE